MMIKRLLFFGALALLLICSLGCERSAEKSLGRDELVRINDVSISIEEFREMSERQPLEGKMRLVSEKGLRDFLENYVITREVLYQEAKRKGLDRNKDVIAKVEDFRRAMLIDALLEQALKGKGEASEAEVQKYYKENQELFAEPREVRVRHIVVNSEPVLKEVLTRLARGESFERLAYTYNVDRSREDGGNLGYIRRGQLAPSFAQFEEAAFSLRKKGQISEIVRTPLGYHLIQLEETRGTALRPFDQVKERIRIFLQAKKRQEAYLEYVKETKSRAKIIVNEKLWAEEEKKEERPKEKRK
ncbi:MAG: peptidyl-prolyl cis-trans isomerase [Syntrophaceae bacterium]|nr:peptidyl-prolyl cis-trans isomerase [Syntrophaceae bacterium]